MSLASTTSVRAAMVGDKAITESDRWKAGTEGDANIQTCIDLAHSFIQANFNEDLSTWTGSTSVVLTNLEIAVAVAYIPFIEKGDLLPNDEGFLRLKQNVADKLQEINNGISGYDYNGGYTKKSRVDIPPNRPVDNVIKDYLDKGEF